MNNLKKPTTILGIVAAVLLIILCVTGITNSSKIKALNEEVSAAQSAMAEAQKSADAMVEEVSAKAAEIEALTAASAEKDAQIEALTAAANEASELLESFGSP